MILCVRRENFEITTVPNTTPPSSSPISLSPSPIYLQRSTLPQPAVPSTWTWCFMLHINIQWCVAILWCLSRFSLSYRWLMSCYDWFKLHVLLLVLSYFALRRASVRDSRCRVLQFVHDFLIVGCVSDRNTNPSKGVVAYGIKKTWCFNAMVGFYLNDL